MNEYLRAFLNGDHVDFPSHTMDSYKNRERLRRIYGYAVPTDEAIQHLVWHGPVVEIGAGRGYWARLIADAGGQIRAFDDFSWENLHQEDPDQPRPDWFPVERGGPEQARRPGARTLLLVWPPYQDPMAADALEAFEGEYVAYVGEGFGGCTADDCFHILLEDEWDLLYTIDIPSYWGLHDDFLFYRRL